MSLRVLLGLVVGGLTAVTIACGAGQPAPSSMATSAPGSSATPGISVPMPANAPAHSAAPHEASEASTESATFQLGPATLEFGPHPPWGAPPEFVPRREEASGNTDDALTVPTQWRLLKTIWVGHGYLHHADLSPDGERVLTVSEQEGALRSYEVKTGRLLHRVPLPGFGEFDTVGFAAMDADHEHVLVVRAPFSAKRKGHVASFVPELVELSTASLTPVPALPSGDGLRFAAPGLIGVSHRVIEPQSGTVSFWWVALRPGTDGAPAVEARLAVHVSCAERPDDWALSGDGKLLAVAFYPSNTVQLFDLEQRQVKLHLPAPQWGGSVALSPDAELLALGGAELRVHAVATGQLVASDPKYQNNIASVRFTPSGDLLLTSAYDRKARSYVLPKKLETLTSLPPPQPLPHSGSNVYALALSPDGRRLVTSSGDQSLKVWVR